VIHLTRIELRAGGDGAAGFPFTIPAIRSLPRLELDRPVTIFVGENGSGKSTLLEAIAIAGRAITAGTIDAHADPTLEGVRALAGRLRLSWAKRTHRGFFMRAEDFFGFARRLSEMRDGMLADLRDVDERYADAPELARSLARAPHEKELGALRERYGDGLDSRSHGEAFLHFFSERFVPGGVYFLDEPEAPLSPTRQLAFLSLLKDMVARDAQIVMATHSPILLSFPDAALWSFDSVPIRPVRWADLEHVTLTRDFLSDPEAYLRHL
jgi:predicted ATPase